MNERLKIVRQATGKNQAEFGTVIGVSGAAVSRWEAGDRSIPDSAIRSICREFCINETWLRTGAGEMKSEDSRAAEMAEAVKRLLNDRPDSFKSALVTTLLRFDPDGPQWQVLEEIYNSIADEMEKP